MPASGSSNADCAPHKRYLRAATSIFDGKGDEKREIKGFFDVRRVAYFN